MLKGSDFYTYVTILLAQNEGTTTDKNILPKLQ